MAAIALAQPPEGKHSCIESTLDLISTEIVFRSLYHFFQTVLRGDASEAVLYLLEHQKLFGLVKTKRKCHP